MIDLSIFYNQNDWHQVISKLLKPFLAEKAEHIESWSIALGTQRGDHVQLIMKFDETESSLNDQLLRRAEAFVLQNQSAQIISKFPLPSFFMNFPNNTVWKDLKLHNQFKEIDPAVHHQISDMIVKALSDAPIDMEVLITLLVYALLGMLKSAFPDIRMAQSAATNLINTMNSEPTLEVIQQSAADPVYLYFKNLFESNRSMLEDIIVDIWNSERYHDELIWMSEWECQLVCWRQQNSLKYTFQYIFTALCEQLGFRSESFSGLAATYIFGFIVNMPISNL